LFKKALQYLCFSLLPVWLRAALVAAAAFFILATPATLYASVIYDFTPSPPEPTASMVAQISPFLWPQRGFAVLANFRAAAQPFFSLVCCCRSAVF
jgi:hypothetical protein